MTIIEIPDNQAAILKAKAAAEGLSLKGWLAKIAAEEANTPHKPKKSGYGLFAKYGPGPSEEDIEANRREMFSGFASDF